jgi:tRNA(Ile)-lysidine synthase
MVVSGETVVVGVSGGMDSVSLLDILMRLRGEFRLTLVVAHVHHGLRAEEGDREFRFVEGLSSRYDVPFEGRKIDAVSYAQGANIQALARRLRLRFYEEVASRWRANKIATGHHRDDHAETLLMQILRGTGGLKGIRPVREGKYIRPLIEIRKEEIQAYTGEMQLAFCEDPSNRKRAYLRNRIRQDLIPWICSEVNPSFSDSLLHLASILHEEARCLDAISEEAVEKTVDPTQRNGEVVLRRDHLERMPRAIQRRVLRQSYGLLEGSTQGLSYAHLEGICDALDKPGGRVHKAFSLPRGIRAFLQYDAVHLSRKDLWEVTHYEYPLCLGEERLIPEAGVLLRADRLPRDSLYPGEMRDPNCAFLDADLSDGEMAVRNARPGDRFYPLGLGGEKKLKDFYIDEKIPRSLRRRIAILEIGGRIGWVVGYRIDDRFRLSPNSRWMIRVRAVELDQHGKPLDRKSKEIKR